MCHEARIWRDGKWELAAAETREAAMVAAAKSIPVAERRWIFIKLAGAWEYYLRPQGHQTKIGINNGINLLSPDF